MTDCIDSDTILLVSGDAGSQISVTVTRDNDGSAVDLTGATPRLKFRKARTTNILFTLTGNDLGSAAKLQGITSFTFSANNLDQAPGSYEGEIEVTFANSDIETVYEIIPFEIRADF